MAERQRAEQRFERLHERYEWEIEQFRRRGLEPRVTYPGGLLRIEVLLEIVGAAVPVFVVYPLDFPIVPPIVYGPPGTLRRHQHATSHNFCLLQSADDWDPRRDAASMVADTLRELFEDNMVGPDAVAAHEADMPEPASSQLPYADQQVVIVPDPFWRPMLAVSGGPITLMPVQPAHVFMLIDAKGIGRAETNLAAKFNRRFNHEGGYWASLAVPPAIGSTPEDVLELALNQDDGLRQALRVRALIRSTADWWLGLTFMEEGPTRAELRRAWVFMQVQIGRGTWRAQTLVQAQALTQEERNRRIPDLVGLGECRFVVAGAGSLGAPIAVELAKAGVGHTAIVDVEIVDVNNPVRHVLPVTAAGLPKAQAVADYCQLMNPFVAVEPKSLTIGGSVSVDDLIHGASMVIDTTGSTAVTRVLFKYCAANEVPLLVVGLTAGAYGGEVTLFSPGGACPVCFELEQIDKNIARPDEGPRSNVTPVGCSHPAFFGAGFDATELAAVATRLAISATGATAYPKAPFDWVVLNFRREPRRIQGTLRSREDCWFHPHL